jgi:hypothetical protein
MIGLQKATDDFLFGWSRPDRLAANCRDYWLFLSCEKIDFSYFWWRGILLSGLAIISL